MSDIDVKKVLDRLKIPDNGLRHIAAAMVASMLAEQPDATDKQIIAILPPAVKAEIGA